MVYKIYLLLEFTVPKYVVVIITKVLLPGSYVTIAVIGYLFRPFGFIAPKHFQIIWLSNLSICSVPADGYSRNAS
jgi:hypothetical protein